VTAPQPPIPATYAACRSRFRQAAADAGAPLAAHPLAVRGADGEELTIDEVAIGPSRPAAALVVLSGVHGVEGFIGSAIQSSFLTDAPDVADTIGVVLVHAVNPWGMSWQRRQNESNVDLNRNWRRSEIEPVHNDAYDLLHRHACPDGDTPPSVDDLMTTALELVDRHGLEWVRNGITRGQYRHPDGLHYGGSRTEESNRILEGIVRRRLTGVERVVVIDLHTGHGPFGELTLLCDSGPDTEQCRALTAFGVGTVEPTVGNPSATTGPKSGQIANGFRDILPDATCAATSAEFGTSTDEAQLIATFLEQWAYRSGRRSSHPDLVRNYRTCFTPTDPAWEHAALDDGRALLRAALASVC